MSLYKSFHHAQAAISLLTAAAVLAAGSHCQPFEPGQGGGLLFWVAMCNAMRHMISVLQHEGHAEDSCSWS